MLREPTGVGAARTAIGIAAVSLTLVLLAGPAGAYPARRPTFSPARGVTRVITPGATANDLAAAMDIPGGQLDAATYTTSDPQGVGVSTSALGRFFPRAGGSYAILSTGRAADAELPNTEDNHTTELGGLSNSQGQDMVQLHLTLLPPSGAQCLSFDFAFFSEEFPEFVGSPFNDVFLAEKGTSNFVINPDNTITAPNNFARDLAGNIISVNSVFGVTPNTQSTYDGGTAILRASVALGPGDFPKTELFLTITDLTDSSYDSTVFLDNFSFSTTGCTAGTALGQTILSPQSGFVTLNDFFDVVFFAPQPITSLTLRVNTVDVSAVVAGCIPGTQTGGGTTARCPNLGGAFFQSVLGPGPYTLDVTAQFQDGSTRSEFVTYQLLTANDSLPGVAILPSTGLIATTQRFDLVLVIGRPDIAGGSLTLDGSDVSAAFLNCASARPVAVLGGGGFAFSCPLIGGVLPPGSHIVSVNLVFSDTTTASDAVVLQVVQNTEP